jgi:hypothetical protein
MRIPLILAQAALQAAQKYTHACYCRPPIPPAAGRKLRHPLLLSRAGGPSTPAATPRPPPAPTHPPPCEVNRPPRDTQRSGRCSLTSGSQPLAMRPRSLVAGTSKHPAWISPPPTQFREVLGMRGTSVRPGRPAGGLPLPPSAHKRKLASSTSPPDASSGTVPFRPTQTVHWGSSLFMVHPLKSAHNKSQME